MKKRIILILVVVLIAIQFITMLTACGNRAWISDSVQNEFNYLVIKEADGEYHIHKIKKWADSETESFTVLTECCGNYIWGSVNNAYLYKGFPEYLQNCIICGEDL